MSKVDSFILEVQKSVCKVKADVDNEFTKSKYADLEGVLDLLNPFFVEHSALIDQSPFFKGDTWVLRTRISVGGEERLWDFPLLGFDSKTPMQSLASAVTYARRYQLKGIFKLVDSDDDANSVTPSGQPSKPARKSEIEKMLRAFAALNVSRNEVEAIVQQDADQFSLEEMEALKSVFVQLKSGKKKLQDFINKNGESQWQD